MDKAGYDLIQQTVQPLGGEVYPVPAEGEDLADVEIRFAIGAVGTSAEFHPSDVVRGLREADLVERRRDDSSARPEKPKLRYVDTIAGSVVYAFSDRRTRPNVMLFEDTNVTRSP